MKTKFLKRIYVEIQSENGGEFMVAHRSYEDAADINQRVVVGIYELVETKTVTAKIELA